MKESRSTERAASVSSAFSMSTSPLSRFTSSTTQPALDELKLSNILNGETCPPISFIDFATFIANKEFTTENLLFILWYRSYKARFDKLESKEKESIPIPSTRLGDRFDPYGYLDRPVDEPNSNSKPKTEDQETPVVFSEPFRSRSASSSNKQVQIAGAQHNCPHSPATCFCIENRAPTCRRTSRLLSITHSLLGSRRPSSASHPHEVNTLRPILHQKPYPPLPPAGTVFAEPPQQPMREEAQRAFATFLRKGGSRELSISDELREYTKLCLAKSTAPEVFLPLYEEIYHTVETQSLPHFLQHATSNINRPKQVFWYMVGAADVGIGAVIYLLLTLLLPAHPFGHRAWRLFSIIFVSFGAMQAYSAYRGFCSQVWGRSHRQVRPWEMDDLDDEETLVEGNPGRNETELKEESYMAEPVPSINRKEIHISLPDEVRPLADLGGVASIPSEEGEEGLAKQDHSPALSKSDSITVALPVLEATVHKEMTQVEKRQLEIRRSTVKVPNASEAFPISDDLSVGFIPSTAYKSSTLDSNRRRKEISPFANDEPTLPSSASSVRGSITNNSNGIPLTRTKSRLHSITSQRANKEISNILLKLRRSTTISPEDEYLDPLASTTSSSLGAKSKSKKLSRKERQLEKEKKKPKIFGPEKLVEDPRIKRVYSEIKRDILIVGSLVAAVWIVLCLAVPCAGLAS
ncbi:hypothetical protein I302_101983 [Kwoniella bestiolae CBS 10118]|uniref:RGS domain-containing protein n=1 Tax=Kwoniella bestiolae CBS 10118 TaxID=1296100 RepID=A0A1B9GDT5_9TREE|nr:hypothetical protein I302_00667 [Kwoniella bestiolae CBS 10118]OCF29171.1 hypothetical protein I302_00667 [Kwoniella bestiolae CBS 10118]